MNNRVKYYQPTDLLFGYNLSKIETIKIPTFDEIDINDAIEFFQIKKYFDAGTRSKTWSDESYREYKVKCDTLSGLTKRFFSQINDDNIIYYYNSIEIEYHSAFWELFDNCKLFGKIKNEVFEVLINGKQISPKDLFLHKRIVRRYGKELRKYIFRNEYGIIILLHAYEQDYTNDEKLVLPDELTGEDINNYFESYIDSKHPNINYLRTIIDMHCTKQFPVSDEIRLKAKKRYEKECENISKTGISISRGIQISFNPNQDEVKIDVYDGKECSISYSTKWLLETLDYPSILNNFIYLFEFVDVPQMRCKHVNRMSQSSVFERAFASKSSRIYPNNYAFDLSNKIASIQMYVYYNFLANQNVRLEDVIKWFFTEQLQSEFGCAEIRLSMPSPNSTYAEKCSSIITAFESVLKQYSLYVKNGEIDFELVEMSATPILFTNIKSMVVDKYIYGVGNNYKQLSFWLFSDQCMFSFVERIHKEGRNYDCFIDLLSKETVYISDYREEEHWAFENMASYDLISIENDGKIVLKDLVKVAIMRDLFQHDVISRWHYSYKAKSAFSDFIEKRLITTQSTLFSQPEIDYLNFLLNRAEYSNGLEIRNKYVHGVLQVNTNEEEHRQNYLLLLRLFVLFAIKVNDDFCLKEDNKKFNKVSQ